MDEAHSIPKTFGISLLVTMSTIASRMDRAYADGDTRVRHARSVSACWTNGFTAGVFDISGRVYANRDAQVYITCR